MSSEESNEMAEEKMAENAADSEPTPPEEETEAVAAQEEEVAPDGETNADDGQNPDEESIEAESLQASDVEADSPSEIEQDDADVTEVETQPATDSVDAGVVGAEFAAEGEDQFSEERIQRILDIELPVNISFGSTKRPLSEVLKLGPGALLELDRAADEPVILKVNNKVFAKGEIVDVDGYYGVQITEIASPAQRIASLGD